MKRTLIIPMLTAIVGVVLALGVSAFKSKPVTETKKFVDHYFRFDGADNSNAEIRAAGNWVDLGVNPPSLPCEESSGIVCYVKYNGDLSAFQTYVSNKTLSDLQMANIIQDYREE